MRTVEEILQRCKDVQAEDWLGVQRGDLLASLTFEEAKPALKPNSTDDGWVTEPRDLTSVIARMREYMVFAWSKVLGHRGLSANRNLDHFKAWLWLIEDDETIAIVDDDNKYENYGAPIMKAICDKYGFPIPEGTAALRMAQGIECDPDGCSEGCGQGAHIS